MKNLLLIVPLLLALCCTGQKASFNEIKLRPAKRNFNTQETTIIFPIVVTGNASTDKLINAQVKTDVFYLEDTIPATRDILKENIEDNGLINLSYKVTFNKNGLLSFFIDAEGCGAHCSSWKTYFNFDLKTGKKIPVDDLFLQNKTDSFKNMVRENKINALKKYKEEEKDNFINKTIDSVEYEWSISLVDENCINSISIENFSLLDGVIEIIDPCEFPNAIRSQQPYFELKYAYKNIEESLNPAFRLILK